MVKIAVAGGSGQVAREVIDALIATKKHEITVLSRHETRAEGIPTEVVWKAVDYGDKAGLTEALQGIHTILSFIQVLWDPEQQTQKNIIEAAIAAGVKRFAPSEFGSQGTAGMGWSKPKQLLREYLQQINANDDVLEYTLFQPGLFLDYLAFPHKTSRYLGQVQTVFDFENLRALVVDGYEEAAVTFTILTDLAAIVTLAVNYEGKWPTTGGITGNRLTASKIIEIGKAVRGQDFAVEKAKIEDLEAGELKTSWRLTARHHAIPEDQASEMLKVVTIGMLLSGAKGSWDSSDEWNRIFPDYKFTQAEEYLAEIWTGRP